MCTQEDHDRLQADPAKMREHTEFLAVQQLDNTTLELRNCIRCSSTLALILEPSPCST
jgi:hypothetical protein